jgi:hypothetical protein
MIEKLAYELETELIIAIVKNLKSGAYGSAQWKMQKLQQLGVLNEEVKALLAKYKAKIILGVGDEVEQSGRDVLNEIKAVLPKKLAGELNFSPAMQNTADMWKAQAAGQANLALSKLAQNAGESYVSIVSKASLSSLLGAETHNEVVKKAILELKDIAAFVDDAGRTWSPEGYISMVVRTNSQRVVNESQFQIAGELGTDLVEVSSHVGARPLCAPYQGKILSLSGKTKGYMTLSETSYREPAGLFGINCGHRMRPYFEGVTEKQQGINNPENDEKYKESQQQRAKERSIRALKREQLKLEAYGDKQGAAAYAQRVKDAQARMRTFIDETGRTRRYDREKVIRGV